MTATTQWKPGDVAIANLNGYITPVRLCGIVEDDPKSWLVSVDFGDGWIVDERLLSPTQSPSIRSNQ